MAVISRARKQGLTLSLPDILQSKSIKDLVSLVRSSAPTSHYQEKAGENFRLSPIQDLYFRSTNTSHGAGRFNQSMTVRVTRKVDREIMERAIKAIVEQHSMFRARFIKDHQGKWQQKITNVRLMNHALSEKEN